MPAPGSDTDSLSPPMIPSETEQDHADRDDMHSSVFQQFSTPYMSDHNCVGPVQALFVASATDPSGSSIAYGIYGGPFSMLNSAHILSGEDRAPPHMARRTPLPTTALMRRADLRGVIVALRQLAQAQQGRLCAHVCVSSAYVAKAWGTWIPQWETHGWPGEESEDRSRSHHLRTPPRQNNLPETPRRPRTYRMMESPGQHSSDSFTGTDSSTSTRRSTRRLVDEDLLRELAALRAELAQLDAQGKARVYLYQIESQHNPAVAQAIQCVEGDAPLLVPDMPLQHTPLNKLPKDASPKSQQLEPMRVFGPVASLAGDSPGVASPLPEDAYLRSPLLARAKSPLAPPPVRPASSRAGTPRSRTASPMVDASRPFSPGSSPHAKGSPLAVPPSKPSPMLSSTQLSHGPFEGITPTMPAAHLPEGSPAHAPLTIEALEKHDRQFGSERTDSRAQRRRARSTRSSVKSDNAQSFIQRLTPRFLRREPKNMAPPKSPPEQDVLPAPASIPPKPRLRTVASQPALRARTQEAGVLSEATPTVSPNLAARSPALPKRVGFSEGVPDPIQELRTTDLERRHEELERREQELARREVEMTRIRFEMERQKKQFDPPRSTVGAPRAAPEEQSDWLWDATLRRTPRLPSAALPQDRSIEPKPSQGAAPITNMQALGAKPTAPPLSRGSQWVMYEEQLPASAASDTTSARSETTSSLGLFVDKGFGQTATLSASKTTICVQIVPAATSMGALVQQIREALIASNQPVDEVLARPFSETEPSDFGLYEKDGEAFVQLVDRAEASSCAKDGTPLCSACGLQDGSVLYVGFRAQSQDVPGLPVVQEPSLEDELDMVEEDPHA
ncbi:hypothetical protein MCAP1_000022 [Malassezia caprae]|uniref:Uncharacterized protein n=1 Tax=Malassezia caprae TaxID=1381934 RepID=A0AAF0IUU6_9BASI|nr:hypothetical protein MCAP1_000022 [Malassezia caprae]